MPAPTTCCRRCAKAGRAPLVAAAHHNRQSLTALLVAMGALGVALAALLWSLA